MYGMDIYFVVDHQLYTDASPAELFCEIIPRVNKHCK
jgi:hypothetical protein